MTSYRDLGLEPIINASGSVTRLGGAPMPPHVLRAFQEAAGEWVPLDHLQAAASRVIAQITGAQAGIVTAGSAAALTLGAAAILTKADQGRMEQLPHTERFPHRFLIAREQRNGYDHAVRAAGVRFVEVGFNEITAGAGVRRTETWEYLAAYEQDPTGIAGVLYVLTPDSLPPLKELVQAAHQSDLPVLVDAAGELPPRSNLRLCESTGADLVAFSGGKAIRGPQSTGVLCGRKDLIAAAALQMLDMDDHFQLWDPPGEWFEKTSLSGIPRHGVGRGLKVSKEEVIALLTALQSFAAGDYLEELADYRRWLAAIATELDQAEVGCRLLEKSDGETPPVLEVTVPRADPGLAVEICRRLRRASPPIYVGHGQLHQGKLIIHPLCLNEQAAGILAKRLREEIKPLDHR